MIRFSCECGKQLQARDENVGKLVLCPACKRQLTVPEAEPTAIQSEAPIELPPAQASIQRQRPTIPDESEEAEDRPIRREPAGSSGKALASLLLGIVSLCGCSCLAGLPSILLGILSLRDISRTAGMMTGKVMAILGIVLGTLGTLCLPPGYFFGYVRVREAAAQQQSLNNLKQMALALQNYHDTYGGRFPPSAVGDFTQPPALRKPNLSWRVALLPFLEQQGMYNSTQFKFDEPWDSPHNIKLLAEMRKIFKLPGDEQTKPGYTHYQVFVGKGAAFEKTRGLTLRGDFPDGTSNTILIVTAEQAVPWTKPDDIVFDPSKPIAPLLSTYFNGGCPVALVDGSVRLLKPNIAETTLKAAITRNGNDVLGPDW